MEIMSREKSKLIDLQTINEVGIPSLVLMENAANKVTERIIGLGEKFIIFCGNGNNGGDGLVIARKLLEENKAVYIVIVSEKEIYSEDFLVNINILKKLTNNFIYLKKEEDIELLKNASKEYTILVDCIFGIGLNRELNKFYKNIINYVNDNWKDIYSIDVPSGLNCDSGEVMGASIIAKKTYTFEVIKRGYLKYKALKYLGEVEVLKIGIPSYIKKRNSEKVYILEERDYGNLLIKRELFGHKGSYGKAVILAGSSGYTGAAYISTEACVRAGAGLTTLVTTREVQSLLCSRLVEAMTMSIDEEGVNKLFETVDVIAIGPGIDNEQKYEEIFKVIANKDQKIVVDAGAFKIIKGNEDILKKIKHRAIFTPHPGEMARLIDRSIDYIEENRIEVAKEYARKYNIVLLLKGYNTVITDGEEVYINTTGNSKMASGGMGDCLTGIITALVAQGHSLINSAILGAYIHGLAGELSGRDKYSVIATEVIKNISKAMNYMNKY
ncbi:MAG: NAD(P)H-hydrate dehydratase [Clostridium sp.]|nr:NAD(P)H-hydrate dehydratase [Clostridium sp.]